MTADPHQRNRDWELAACFSDTIKDRVRALLRDGLSIEAAADQMQVPIGAARNWNIKVQRERRECTRLARRQAKRDRWEGYDAALLTKARHAATRGADAAMIASETGLPPNLCAYIVKRADLHRRRRAHKAAQAAASAPE